ncbi:MAG: hypothetical protein HDS56_07180 [Barnesiella sp.]|nr:hypothetical protein [Barnesiella sp.]
MKKITSAIRIIILLALAFTATFGILSVPADECSSQWLSDLIASKAIGFGAAVILCVLYSEWSLCDDIVRAFDRWCTAIKEEQK